MLCTLVTFCYQMEGSVLRVLCMHSTNQRLGHMYLPVVGGDGRDRVESQVNALRRTQSVIVATARGKKKKVKE